jgi:hypothetical protein
VEIILVEAGKDHPGEDVGKYPKIRLALVSPGIMLNRFVLCIVKKRLINAPQMPEVGLKSGVVRPERLVHNHK